MIDDSELRFWRPNPGVKRLYIDGPEGQLHVRVNQPSSCLDKLPLYCIHQSPSSSVALAALVAAMGEDRACAAGDTPGFGESDPPENRPEIEDYAMSHGAIIDGLGWNSQINLFGFFTGSKIAVALALARPEQIKSLVLFGAPLYKDEELDHERTTYKADLYDWEAGYLNKWWRHLRKGAPSPYPLSLFARHFAEIQRGGPQSWWGHRAAFNFDLREWLPKLSQPTLVLCSADPQGEKSLGAVNYLKDGRSVHIPYMGQGLLDLHTAEVCAHLRFFLDH